MASNLKPSMFVQVNTSVAPSPTQIDFVCPECCHWLTFAIAKNNIANIGIPRCPNCGGCQMTPSHSFEKFFTSYREYVVECQGMIPQSQRPMKMVFRMGESGQFEGLTRWGNNSGIDPKFCTDKAWVWVDLAPSTLAALEARAESVDAFVVDPLTMDCPIALNWPSVSLDLPCTFFIK